MTQAEQKKKLPSWIRKRPVHLISVIEPLTPCGKNAWHMVMRTSTSTHRVTCKLCKKTNWYKDKRAQDLESSRK